jgi:hypothetical protein
MSSTRIPKTEPAQFSRTSADSNELFPRVTRLGDISPFGRLFNLGDFLKTTEIGQVFLLRFPTLLLCNVLVLTKHGLGYSLGEFFSQTHLVTLIWGHGFVSRNGLWKSSSNR